MANSNSSSQPSMRPKVSGGQDGAMQNNNIHSAAFRASAVDPFYCTFSDRELYFAFSPRPPRTLARPRISQDGTRAARVPPADAARRRDEMCARASLAALTILRDIPNLHDLTTAPLFIPQRPHSGPDVLKEEMPTGLAGGAQVYVTGAPRSVSLPISASKLSSALLSLGSVNSAAAATPFPASSPTPSSSTFSSPSSISPPPAYTSIYPPSPPQSQPSSPVTVATLSSAKTSFTNPLQAAVSSPRKPIKPLLTPRSSQDDTTSTRSDPSVVATVFPSSSPAHALPHSSVDLTDISAAWKGAVLENPAMGTRTLYVTGGSYADVNMRESVCGVLEKAEDELACTGVVMCLEKNTPDLGELIHQLLYVGGTITTGPFTPNPAYILVGMDV